MADSPISSLGTAGALDGTEVLATVQSSTTKKVTVRKVAELVVAPLYTVELIDVYFRYINSNRC